MGRVDKIFSWFVKTVGFLFFIIMLITIIDDWMLKEKTENKVKSIYERLSEFDDLSLLLGDERLLKSVCSANSRIYLLKSNKQVNVVNCLKRRKSKNLRELFIKDGQEIGDATEIHIVLSYEYTYVGTLKIRLNKKLGTIEVLEPEYESRS